jgi:RNA polymerase sigma factor (sigma-70 family)
MKLSKITVEDAIRIQKNEREFTKFINENSNFINKLVHKYVYKKNRLNLNDSELFEDAKQEALLSLWSKALPKYNGSNKFSTFAYVVIKNDLIQFLQRKSKFEQEKGELISIESLKRNFNGDGGGNSEYLENKWQIDPRKVTFEESLIKKIQSETDVQKIHRTDYVIIELRKRNFSREKIAQALGLNIHSYKTYYYNVFKKRSHLYLDKKLEIINDVQNEIDKKKELIKELRKRNWSKEKIKFALEMVKKNKENKK